MDSVSIISDIVYKLLLFIFGSILISTIMIGQNDEEETLAARISGKIVTQIKFVNKSGVIVVPVRINDSKILNMILDTGMSGAVVVLFHKESIEELKLENGQIALLGGAGGEKQKQGSLFTGVIVNLEDIEMNNQTLVVFDEARETSGWSWDGVIGKSLFDKYVTEIDYENSTLTFYEPEDFNMGSVNPIPLNLDYGFPVIETEIGIGLYETIRIKSVVDIGHRSTFLIKEDSLKNILPPCVTIDAIAGRGIQGEVMSKIGRIRELNIGQYSLYNIPASFLDENENMGVPSSIAEGNIGNLILNRFKLILDYSRKQIFLVKNKNFGNPFEINMAGLIIEQNKDGVALVRHVVENSPASEKGILKGDLITSVNGKDIQEYNFDDLYNLFTKEGDELILNLDRNGEKIIVTVKLQKLI